MFGATRLACAFAVLIVVAGGGAGSHAASSGVSVSLTVPSATTLDTSSCASDVSGRTDFGTVLPSTTMVTGIDCTVGFGSSNDTSMLRVAQTDREGQALWRSGDGPLDTGFAGSGKVTTGFPAGGTDAAADVVVAPGGKAIAVGVAGTASVPSIALARYDSAGALDPTFSGDGMQTTVLGGVFSDSNATSVVLQDDGRVVVGGYSGWNYGGPIDFIVARYLVDGTLDPSFSGDGLATTNFGGGDRIHDAIVQPDGKIVVVGEVNNPSWNGALARYRTDGSLDPTFGVGGTVTTPELASFYAVALQPDGRILAAGQPGGGGYVVYRFLADGTPDPSFDGDGRASTTVLSWGAAESVVVQQDGKIVLSGFAGAGATAEMALVRFDANGSLDLSFSADGKLDVAVTAANDDAQTVLQQSDGKLVAAGYAGSPRAFGVIRVLPDGTLDSRFGSAGSLVVPLGADDVAAGLAFGTDGRLVLAGWSGSDFGLLRLAGLTIPNYQPAVADWTSGTSSFGACLRSVAGTGVTAGWTLDANADCTATNSDPWNAVPGSPATVARSTISGTTNATAHVRFGVRTAPNQPPGRYTAAISFEVIAPAT